MSDCVCQCSHGLQRRDLSRTKIFIQLVIAISYSCNLGMLQAHHMLYAWQQSLHNNIIIQMANAVPMKYMAYMYK